MVSKVKEFFSKEEKVSKVIFAAIILAAFLLIVSPSIAQFLRQTGDTGWGNGYGYGYGYGYGFDHGTYSGYRDDSTYEPDPSVYGYGFGYGNMVSAPENGVYTVTPDDMASLVEAGIMTPNGGPGTATEVTFNSEVELDVAAGITVTIPSGTTFTAGEGTNFADLAAANDVSTAGLSGFRVAGEAISFGIPDLDLTVDPAITIAITVGASYNGQTLSIYRMDADGVWSDSGTTCLVASGICSFETTHLSSFATGKTSSSGGGGAVSSDTTAPTSLSIVINNGDASTTSRTVTLALAATDASGVSTMMISNNADFSGASSEAYAVSKSWTLTEGNGTKTVYVKFTDSYSNVSSVVSDTITLTGQTFEQPLISPQQQQAAQPLSSNPADFDYKWIGQTPYPTIVRGQTATLWVEVKNTGKATWNSAVHFGSSRPLDRNCGFMTSNWLTTNRAGSFDPAFTVGGNLPPGYNTRFTFTVTAPSSLNPGTYREYFRPVVEGLTWMKDVGIYWDITVQ